MERITYILAAIYFLSSMGCKAFDNSILSPSIHDLQANEVLVMDYNSCHWGCTSSTIKFQRNEAIFEKHRISLTENEIKDLDSYFQTGKNPDEGHGCSIPIEISFKLMRNTRTLKSKEVQIYPCTFGQENKLVPHRLVLHLTKNPSEVPPWRLSQEEQSKQSIIE